MDINPRHRANVMTFEPLKKTLYVCNESGVKPTYCIIKSKLCEIAISKFSFLEIDTNGQIRLYIILKLLIINI